MEHNDIIEDILDILFQDSLYMDIHFGEMNNNNCIIIDFNCTIDGNMARIDTFVRALFDEINNNYIIADEYQNNMLCSAGTLQVNEMNNGNNDNNMMALSGNTLLDFDGIPILDNAYKTIDDIDDNNIIPIPMDHGLFCQLCATLFMDPI